MTQPVAFDYSETATEALLSRGVDDPRCDPEFFEASVRALLAEWLVTVDVDAGTSEVCVRDPRLWLIFVAGPELSDLSLSVYVAGRRWHRGEPEPSGDTSMAAAEHWNFVVTWPLLLLDDGPWQLGDSTTQTLAEVTGYRFISRKETIEEYAARTGVQGPPTQAPATRRFLLVASMVDDAAYTGGTATTIVERPAAPTRLQAEDLMQPVMQAELRRTGGEAEYQPTITALASYELLD